MRIIDRYILRQFLWTFLVCYVSLTGLYVVFDAFTNMENFLRAADQSGGLLPLLASHYGYHAIGFFDRTAGMLVLTSSMFTVSWLQRHQEMTALLAAGVSRTRIVAPILVAAITIHFAAAANRELVIPQFREQLSRTSKDLIGDVAQ
jgi:lipopolysaccharide export system permease protein